MQTIASDPHAQAAWNAREMMKNVSPLLWKLIYLRELEMAEVIQAQHPLIDEVRRELFEALREQKALVNNLIDAG